MATTARRLCIQQAAPTQANPLYAVYHARTRSHPPTMNKSTDKADGDMKNRSENTKHYLLASDFDQTLSFNDSGIVLSELLGNSRFGEKVAGLSNMNLVQQGGELAYLLLHDPEYRRVRKDDLIEVGKRIRLKQNIHELSRFLT